MIVIASYLFVISLYVSEKASPVVAVCSTFFGSIPRSGKVFHCNKSRNIFYSQFKSKKYAKTRNC